MIRSQSSSSKRKKKKKNWDDQIRALERVNEFFKIIVVIPKIGSYLVMFGDFMQIFEGDV